MISSYGSTDHIKTANEIAAAIRAGQIENTTAWEATTNIVECGGLNPRGRAIIHRALRQGGYHFFLAKFDDDGQTSNSWGILHQSEIAGVEKDSNLAYFETGYTLDHAAHKLGKGDAKKGWALYHAN